MDKLGKDIDKLNKDMRFLLRFFWGAGAIIGLLVVLTPVGVALWIGDTPTTGVRGQAAEVAE